ncbi:MAG: hypothetical protein AAFQ65_10425 [Myxococcota bacterium]
MSKKSCKRQELLAKNDFGHISQCGCGVAHINLGPMTIRIPADGLAAVAELFAQAVATQRKPAEEVQSVIDPQLAH